MAKRKEKPIVVYREETYGNPQTNSVRQTFKREDFDEWVNYALKHRETTTKFFIGTIDWKEFK